VNWQVALRLGRVSNLPTVWTNVATGIVLAGGGYVPLQAALLLVALSLFYVGGMYLNDFFDRDIDRRERPERPIASGLVEAQTVGNAGFAMLVVALVLLTWVGYGIVGGTGWRTPLAGLALAATIVFYDWYHKNNPLSPLVMGLCRVLVYITAGSAVVTVLPTGLLIAAAMLLCYLIGLTYIAKQENVNQLRSMWPLLFLVAPFLYTLPLAAGDITVRVPYVAFALWVTFALSFLLRGTRRNVPRAVAALLAGICLLDALLIAGHGQTTLAWLAGVGFVLTLLLQRYVPAT
jgi:4-hydroxybenzoate polyprenyltransferase